jgi:RTX calcium-binding nonapeptide repeat (4 copies)
MTHLLPRRPQASPTNARHPLAARAKGKTTARVACALLAATLAITPAATSPAATAAVPTCQGKRATIVGTAKAEKLVGTPRRDVIVGRAGDDVIKGRGGDDLICGGEGADTLRGGLGDDRLYGQGEAWHDDRGGAYFTSDLLDGGPGDDLLDTGGDHRSVAYGSHGILDFTHARKAVTVDLAAGTATGQGRDTLVLATLPCDDFYCYSTEALGSAYDDTLLGSDDADHLVGNAGDDHLDGRDGADELEPDPHPREHRPAGDDVVVGGPGNDFLDSRDGHDQLFGDDGVDQVWALEGGPAELYGGNDNDSLVVAFSSEPGFVFDGGQGHDRGQLARSFDPNAAPIPTSATVTMADGRVVADNTQWGQILGIEELALGGPAKWEYFGTDAPDIVTGVSSLRASTYGGDDTVIGSDFADWIDVGDGNDTVYAQGGRDSCLNAEEMHGCEVTD